MEKGLSVRSVIVCTVVSATIILLCLFPASIQSIGQSIALFAISIISSLLLRNFLMKKEPLERAATTIALLFSLAATALLASSLRALLPSNVDLFSLFSIGFSIAFFSILFPISKDLSKKAIQNLAPWVLPVNSLNPKSRILIPDLTCLEDGRLCDLVRTGLLDNQLIIPHALIEKVKSMLDDDDELVKERAKQAYETYKKLETFGIQTIKHKDFDSVFETNFQEGLLSYARAIGGTILSNDSAIKNGGKAEHADVPVVFIEAVASSFKPVLPKGQQFSIKIQRLGKEPKQGIGYLDDRTMVVVNGGGDYLGRMVKTQVLSQKYSSSGKIIFCNLIEEDNSEENRDIEDEYQE